MKKIIVLLLVFCILLSFPACQKKESPEIPPSNSTAVTTATSEPAYPETIMCMAILDSTVGTGICRDESIIREFVDMMKNCTYTEISQEEYDHIFETAEDKKEHYWKYIIQFGSDEQAYYSFTKTCQYFFAPNLDYKEEGDPVYSALYQVNGFDTEIFSQLLKAREKP